MLSGHGEASVIFEDKHLEAVRSQIRQVQYMLGEFRGTGVTQVGIIDHVTKEKGNRRSEYHISP